MDPRNFLDETNIFQFQSLAYSANDNLSGVNAILKGTFMEGTKKYSTESINYANTFLDVAKNTGVSAYHLASRVKQEQGKNGTSPLISGTYSGYKGYYNFFNFNAYGKTKEDIIKDYPHYFDKVTVEDAISNLQDTTEDGCINNPKAITNYQKYLACKNDKLTNHTKTKHSKVAIDRMKRVSNGENFTALDEKINSVHSGAYGRLCWDEQAPTITTRFDTPAGGRFIHPKEDRTLSPREAARIQSFPDDFIFYGNKTSICKQIGNAVPPKVSYFLARLINKIF